MTISLPALLSSWAYRFGVAIALTHVDYQASPDGVVHPAIPQTPSGKVARAKCRRRYLAGAL